MNRFGSLIEALFGVLTVLTAAATSTSYRQKTGLFFESESTDLAGKLRRTSPGNRFLPPVRSATPCVIGPLRNRVPVSKALQPIDRTD
jgi:hypothetical protein